MPRPDEQPSPEVRPSQVTLKTVFTIAFGVVLVIAVVMAVIHSLLAITLSSASLLLAVALDHGVQLLIKRGLRRSLAIAAVSLAMLGTLIGLGFTLIPPAVTQGRSLIQHGPEYVRTAQHSHLFQRLDQRFHLGDRIQEVEKNSANMLEGAATPVLAAVGGVLSFVGAGVTVFFLMVFMLIFGERVVQAILDETRLEHRRIYEDLLHKIYQSIGGYVGGLTLICAINATLTTTFLAINRVPFFLPLAILSGLSSMIPYAGPFVTGSFISLLTFVTGGAWHGLATVIYFVTYGQLEGNVLGPLIFRRTVHVNALIVTLSILFLGEMAGIPGAIVAVPVVATLQIVVRELLRFRRQQLRLQQAARARSAASPDV